jgi:hypothetical protein
MQHRSLQQAHKIIGAVAMISCLGVVAANAVPIVPGATVLVPGTSSAARPELAGTIVRDESIPFQITSSTGAVLASGIVQDRVIRETTAGSLDFYVHVTNKASSTANLTLVTRSDFGPVLTDVDWRSDGGGTKAPLTAWRSPTADTVGFSFSSPNNQVTPGADTRFSLIKTNARSYVVTGVTTIQAVLPTGAVAGTARVVTATPYRGTAAATYHIFTLGTPDLTTSQVAGFARRRGLIAGGGNTDTRQQTFVDGDGSVRIISDFSDGRLIFAPNLALATGAAPDPRAASKNALDYLQEVALLPAVRIGSLEPSDIVTTARGTGEAVGANPKGTDVLRTVNIIHRADGLRIDGPYSLLSVDLSSAGPVGVTRTMRPLAYDTAKVDWKPYSDAAAEFSRKLGELIGLLRKTDPKVTYKLMNYDLAYVEQGLKFVQPAYRFQVEFRSSEGALSGQTFVIPASNTPPEVINDAPINQNPATEPALRGAIAHIGSGASPIDYGIYVVRGDDRFLDDAWRFHTNLDAANSILTPVGYKPVHFNQYFKDYPWLWENWPAGGIGDNSANFVGKNQVVLYEGHGAPWLATTYSNNADLIDYRTLPGYGGNNGKNGKTAFIIWHTCDSIPAPGDPHANYYQSPAGPFDIWFGVFKGLRGTYGARTTVGIYNNAGPAFAFAAGLGMPNLNAWFNANNAGGHSGGWNYGSAVILAGHENDRIYDNAAGPSAGALTMWWQHP